jgi:RNA polymerase sigma-70 factor (TIGR02943 family)
MMVFLSSGGAIMSEIEPILPHQSASEQLFDHGYLAELRQQMIKFATLQLSDPSAAEDAVHEALLGALRNSRTFAGTAAFKTWVFAILKNKIADTLRKKQRRAEVTSPLDGDEAHEHLFNARGFWNPMERPNDWADPEKAMESSHFWAVFEICLEDLSARQARVFMMREFIQLEAHEICEALELSVSNLHVLLHRARLRLRECLEKRWFMEGNA